MCRICLRSIAVADMKAMGLPQSSLKCLRAHACTRAALVPTLEELSSVPPLPYLGIFRRGAAFSGPLALADDIETGARPQSLVRRTMFVCVFVVRLEFCAINDLTEWSNCPTPRFSPSASSPCDPGAHTDVHVNA